MDPLSDVLSLLKPRAYMAGGFDMGGEWSIRFGEHKGVKCYAVVSGQCWLSVEGVQDAVRLTAGDCFRLPRGWPFRLASDLALKPVDAHTIFQFPLNGGIASHPGAACFSIEMSSGVFPNGEEILIGRLRLGPISRQRVSPAQAKMRESSDECVYHNSRMVVDFLKLSGCFVLNGPHCPAPISHQRLARGS
jgi:hypothetical protein